MSMSPEIHELIESVRGLGIRLTGQPSPKCVRVADPVNFPDKLERVQRALDSVDAAAAQGTSMEFAPTEDPAKLKDALDRILRLYQIKGGSLEEADAAIKEALGLEQEETKKKRGMSTLPAFAPDRLKKKRGYKPRLKIMPERPGEVSMGELRGIVNALQHTVAMLGDTFPKEVPADRRPPGRRP